FHTQSSREASKVSEVQLGLIPKRPRSLCEVPLVLARNRTSNLPNADLAKIMLFVFGRLRVILIGLAFPQRLIGQISQGCFQSRAVDGKRLLANVACSDRCSQLLKLVPSDQQE